LLFAFVGEIAGRKGRFPFIESVELTLGVGLLIVLEEVVFFLTFLVLLGRVRRLGLLRR